MSALEYGTVEYREGTDGLQEVVKSYVPHKREGNYYDLTYLKIVRTPNMHKLVDGAIEGCEYSHRVYACVVPKGGYLRGYFTPSKSFPDTQEGLSEAERYANRILIDYGRNKWHHPKKWIKHILA